MDNLSMSVGRDYRSWSAYEYVIYEGEHVVARKGWFSSYAQAKRQGLAAAKAIMAGRGADGAYRAGSSLG